MSSDTHPPTIAVPVGTSCDVAKVVGAQDTALAVGSGDLPVLATPILIALMEAAACQALIAHLPQELTSVGSAVNIRHVGPSAIGTNVVATATVTQAEGEKVAFEVAVRQDLADGTSVVVGRGTHSRVIVDRASFLAVAAEPRYQSSNAGKRRRDQS